jgi:predicted helicase
MALLTCKQQSSFPFQHVFVTRLISDLNSVSAQSKEQSYVFPLYLYDDKGERMVNFNPEVVNRIACSGLARSERLRVGASAGMACPTTVDPEVIFDYVYAVLHSRHYRKRYKELLRIDFPHIPYPKDNEQLKTLSAIGEKLRRLHLLEDIPAGVNALGVSYLGQGSDVVEKYEWRDDAVYINDENHFQGIPEEVWTFYIGGYQPMQKWLQYRKGRRLAPDDIIHYERMAYAINRTLQLMEKIEQFV